MMTIRKSIYSVFLLLIAVFFIACGSNTVTNVQQPAENQAQLLADYFLQNGDYINQETTPAILNAAEVYPMLANKNILIVDVRPAEQFVEAHIPGAINVQPADLVDFMLHRIEAPAFDAIVFVDNRGQVSAYVTAITRLLGFDNTFSLRFGLSSWNEAFATQGWDLAIGTNLEGKLEKTPHPQAAPTQLPALQTKGASAYQIAVEQAKKLLAAPSNSFLKTYQEVIDPANNFYIVNYWPIDKYLQVGHLPGAVQYNPKSSLHPEKDLRTLPLDRPIAIYCYTGQHSANVTAYLRMLGYDAYSLIYGSNSFIHETLKNNEKKAGHYWSDVHKNNLPLSGGKQETPAAIDVEVKSVLGGC